MNLNPASALACVFLATTLTACATYGNSDVTLAPVPGDLRACFDRLVSKPPGGDLTKKQMFRIVADLRASEESKSQCGKRLLAWYDAQAAVYAGQK